MKKLVTLLGVLALISCGEKKSSDIAQSSEDATSVEAAKEEVEAASSGLESLISDANVEQCTAFCKQESAKSHCQRCKCKACPVPVPRATSDAADCPCSLYSLCSLSRATTTIAAVARRSRRRSTTAATAAASSARRVLRTAGFSPRAP